MDTVVWKLEQMRRGVWGGTYEWGIRGLGMFIGGNYKYKVDGGRGEGVGLEGGFCWLFVIFKGGVGIRVGGGFGGMGVMKGEGVE